MINKIFKRKLLIFSYPSVLTYVLGAQKNRLTGSFEHSKHMLRLTNKKIIFDHTHVHVIKDTDLTVCSLQPHTK